MTPEEALQHDWILEVSQLLSLSAFTRSCDVVFVQGHHGRTRAISRLPVSPSAGHTASHHGSHQHLNGHAPSSDQESPKRRPQPNGFEARSKVAPESSRVNGQLKRSSLVIDSKVSGIPSLGRQMSKEGTRNPTHSTDQSSRVGTLVPSARTLT